MILTIISLAIISIVSLITSIFCILKVLSLWVEIESFKKSTHSVQFVGATPEGVKMSEKIESFEKEYREQAQEAYPEFATFKEDLELKGL